MIRPVAADWLQLRRDADHRARESAIDQITAVSTWLRQSLRADQTATVIDLGAGTGSNQAWLAPRLQVPQHWVLVDHDADLLHTAADAADEVHSATPVVGTVDQLPQLLPHQGPTVVTCAALLDLLTPQNAALIAETVSSAQAAAVLSLSVTGEVRLSPEDPADARIAAAFDAHQRREDLLGPGAAEVVAAQLRGRGAHVEVIRTDWILDHAEPALVERYLSDRVQAATEHDDALAEEADQWLQRRLRQLHQGTLRVRVGHHDVVSLPRRPAAPSSGGRPGM